MTSTHTEILIIGGGGMGLSAAYQLAKMGTKPLVLEQFKMGHTRGSSHTEHRLIRRTYNDDIYSTLMPHSYRLWAELEKDAGRKLVYLCGGVEIGPEDDPTLTDIIRISRELDVPTDVWTPAEARQHYPQFHLRPNWIMAFCPMNGFVAVDDAQAGLWETALRMGATIRDEEPVLQIEPLAHGARVVTTKGEYTCDKLIVAAGAYVKKLLAQTGLDVPYFIEVNQVQWFESDDPAMYMPDKFPVWIVRDDHEPIGGTYGFPTFRYPGTKAGIHHSNVFIDVEQYDQQPRPETTEKVAAFMREFIPGASQKILKVGACLYDFPPDEHFVISKHPQYPDISMANMAGHGYKFTPLVGLILAQFATQGRTEFDLTGFDVARFFDENVPRRKAIHVDVMREQAL